jgi:hypothetical protein
LDIKVEAMNVADIINGCLRKFHAQGLDALTADERLVALARWADCEVELGGVGAFLHNSAGAYTREVVNALIRLGAMNEAAAINRGRELLRKHSWQDLATSGQFERLTDLFLASMPGLFERIAAFVELHAEELGVTTQQSVLATDD